MTTLPVLYVARDGETAWTVSGQHDIGDWQAAPVVPGDTETSPPRP